MGEYSNPKSFLKIIYFFFLSSLCVLGLLAVRFPIYIFHESNRTAIYFKADFSFHKFVSDEAKSKYLTRARWRRATLPAKLMVFKPSLKTSLNMAITYCSLYLCHISLPSKIFMIKVILFAHVLKLRCEQHLLVVL